MRGRMPEVIQRTDTTSPAGTSPAAEEGVFAYLPYTTPTRRILQRSVDIAFYIQRCYIFLYTYNRHSFSHLRPVDVVGRVMISVVNIDVTIDEICAHLILCLDEGKDIKLLSSYA